MTRILFGVIQCAWVVTAWTVAANWQELCAQNPPYHGTIFLESKILTEEDPSAFVAISDSGTGRRRMFDRRTNDWVDVEAWLFPAEFDDGQTIEVQVNPEFEQKAARKESEFYARVIGRLPRCLRDQVKTVWIHAGKKLFGGGNRNLLIHTEQGKEYLRDGILEETLCHEASHTSLDGIHARSDRWRTAQSLDDGFISKYAKENPEREDVAETFLIYLALKHRRDRISDELAAMVSKTVPNRLAYFDGIEWDLYPMVKRTAE
ncbi:MAG: hypothetical protein FJ308_17115 [Planctomycetes bacterium]|nr:hypothetical protein [Planctomycetota bacterium]